MKKKIICLSLLILSGKIAVADAEAGYYEDVTRVLHLARSQTILPSTVDSKAMNGTLLDSESLPAKNAWVGIATRVAVAGAKAAQSFINRGGGPGLVGGAVHKAKEIHQSIKNSKSEKKK